MALGVLIVASSTLASTHERHRRRRDGLIAGLPVDDTVGA
jgi:hypothetical protein